jgi:hypothetical protein
VTIQPQWEQTPDTTLQTILYWFPLGMWSGIRRCGVRYGLHFGFVPPWEVGRPMAAVSLVAERVPVPLSELIAKGTLNVMAIARADDGRRFLVQLIPDPRGCAADIVVGDASGTAPAAIIGHVGSADFVQTATAFAQHSHRHRAVQETDASS